MLSTSRTLPNSPSLSKKVLVLHRLSNRESDKNKINNEIDSFFNCTNKFLEPTSQIVVGRKIHFTEFSKIGSPPRASISPKRLQNKKTGTKCSSDHSTMKSGIINLMDENQNSSIPNNLEIIDNKRLKIIFDSFKDNSLKNSLLNNSLGSKGQLFFSHDLESVPHNIRSKLCFQSKNLEQKEKSDTKAEKLAKYLSKRLHKNESDLLMNKIDYFRFKKEILNNIENSRPLDGKYGKYKWNISLRRPDKFSGVRDTYVNIRTDDNPFWALIKEKYPKDKEISLKPGCNIDFQEYQGFLKNPYLLSESGGNCIKTIENIDNLNIKGENLFELEYNDAMSTKKNKILHKVFYDNGKAIFDKDVNELFGNKMIYKNYNEKRDSIN